MRTTLVIDDDLVARARKLTGINQRLRWFTPGLSR
jgi:hypothetical protein